MEVLTIKSRKILFLSLVMMLIICCLSALSASDNNDTTTTHHNSLNKQEFNNVQPAISTKTNTKQAKKTATKNIQKNDKKTNLTKTSTKVGTREELEKTLNDASTGSTVYLQKDYVFNTSVVDQKIIPINKTLTIDGRGHTLDALHDMGIFRITADNVVLRNITFINGFNWKESGGVAIDWIGKSGILEDCIFKNNTPRSDLSPDGVIYVEGNDFTAKNCYFENNAAFRGAGFYLNSNNNEIINCTFNRNNGFNDDYENRLHFKYSAGSGIFISGENNLIKNCVFKNQRTVYGTIFIDGEKNIIKNNIFQNNYVYRDGGAIYINKPKNMIIGCEIENNTAKKCGGAIYIDDTNNEINDCMMTLNYAKEGGAIYINKQSNIVNSCIIYDNRALEYGGAIYVDAKNNKINNNIIYLNNLNYNIQSRGPRNDIYSSVKMTVDKNWWGNVNTDICDPIDSIYMKNKFVKPITNNKKVTVNTWYYIDVVDKSNNTIPKIITRVGDYAGNKFDFKIMFKLVGGGGDFNYPYFTNEFNLTGDKLRLFDGVIYQDKIVKGFTGDSLAFNMLTNNPKSILKFENSIFGVEVPITLNETYPLTRLQEIIDNVSEKRSADISGNYKYDADIDANLTDGVIVNKTITLDGNGATIDLDYKTRGFYVNAPEVIIKNINIKNGNIKNGGMGGAIFLDSKFGEIINATFEGNTAYYGGAVAITENYATVTNSTFKNNYASEKGAGIYIAAKGLRFTNNLFDSNHAAYGEDPCVEGYTWAISFSDNNTYINNSITGIGGKDDDNTPTYKPKHNKIKQFSIINRKSYVKQIFHDKITLKNNGKEIPITNNQLTLDMLNQIFNQNFTNGHLLVYIDGKLIFNDTTTEDTTQLIYKLIDLLSGNHEIKVEFTNKEGNTNNFTETITV